MYREIRGRFGDQVEITVIDPRNQIVLIPMILRDIFTFKVGLREGLKTFLKGCSIRSVIINGKAFSLHDFPDSSVICDQLEKALSISASSPSSLLE